MQDQAPTLIARIAAGITGSIGLIVFIGWAVDVEPMRRAFISHIHMLPNTAVGLVAAGVALWLSAPRTAHRNVVRLAKLLALFVFLLGAVTFVERVFDWDAGIDRLLFADLVETHRYRPLGRMAANSAIGLAIAGLSLLTLDVTVGGYRKPGAWLATTGLIIASIAIVGYLYDAQQLYLGDVAAGQALSAALSFLCLHFGILAARPSGGIALVASNRPSGMVLRRLLVALAVVPLLLGKLLLIAREEALVGRETSIAVFVVVMTSILIAITVRSTLIIEEGDRDRDETLRREAEARAEAERAIHAKNDFLAVMSHELRTPLNAIIGYSSLLADGIPEPVSEAQARQIERISASARHLLALIDEVLTLSRMELGQEQIMPTEVRAAHIMEEAASMIEVQARAKSLSLEVQLPGPGIVLQTDPRKLRQALVNILGNAVKFTEKGTIRFRMKQEGDLLSFEVEDSGAGIAPEHLDRIFDSFWQVDQALSRRAGGVGLGLYVTRQLTRLLGGEVLVTSTRGVGSCFVIRIPQYWWGTSTAEFPRVVGRITPMSNEPVSV